MKYLLVTKQYMTQVFDEEGRARSATVLFAEPNTVTMLRSTEKDGYAAVQVGVAAQKESRVNKAQRPSGLFKHRKEFRLPADEAEKKVGDTIAVADMFQAGDVVDVSGISKGKGFQGVVKRHGFSGGPRTHGQKHNERQPGSIGGGLRARVPKGMKMAGRMGADRVTVRNLTVLAVDPERNELIVEGAVPGRRGTLIEVYSHRV
jgi:large subunit ribosomal protein L3